jgi:uncharacterized RDD family membrane protein YckC
MLGVGAIGQALFYLLATSATGGFAVGIFMAFSQSCLLLWTFCLGTLLALFLKDKNLLVPMTIFLALFDIWLVFAPEGVANQATHGNRKMVSEILNRGGYQIPAPAAVSHNGFASPLAVVGPADWLFLAMFFVALYRFRMRTVQTAVWMTPVLAAYLMIVLFFRDSSIGPFKLGALPALLPIGAVILLVNWREFKLTKDEVRATIVLCVGAFAIMTWRLMVSLGSPERPTGPLQPGPGQAQPESPGSHQPIYPA